MKTIQNNLDAPNQRYQKYLRDVDAWERRRQEIIGSRDIPDSLEWHKYQREQVREAIPTELNSLKARRNAAVRNIYREIAKRVDTFRECYAPVLKAVGKERGVLDSFGVSFDVVIDGSSFGDKFFDFVNQGISGTFCGVAEGRQRLQEMIPQGTFDTEDSTIMFVDSIMDALTNDLRDTPSRPSAISKQLRKGVTVENVYDFLFALEYLEPRYALKVNGRTLQELSPGERGLLLLIFYLLIDKDNTPLIIDQPEENLDNQSVKSVLVPCIKAAKERRQLFIVTHNPNVAVVCDAEQIIYCSINKFDGSKVVYESGSIEDGIINRQLVNVLEGTAPAFENRTLKYRTVGSLE